MKIVKSRKIPAAYCPPFFLMVFGLLKITSFFLGFANEADEVRLALDWQGFVVDIGEVDALVHEVGQRQGLNQPGA